MSLPGILWHCAENILALQKVSHKIVFLGRSAGKEGCLFSKEVEHHVKRICLAYE